jgi:hypothetical protein
MRRTATPVGFSSLGMSESAPGEDGSLREMAKNYGCEAAKKTVAKTVDCLRPVRKKASYISRVDRTPLLPNATSLRAVSWIQWLLQED